MKKVFYVYLFAVLYLISNFVFAFNNVENAYLDRPNYLKNPAFEEGRNTYTLYADAAGTVPVDGTGGTANITRTLNATNPIGGGKDLVITKDAADRQGNGVATTVTLPAGLQTKQVEISFDYYTSSAYADDDMIVYIYDITNAALIEPTPRAIKAYAPTTAGASTTWRGSFPAAYNSKSYRIIWHVSSTNASAYTMHVDNIRVGLPATSNGAVVTEWKTVTMTVSHTNTTVTAKERIVGNCADYDIEIVYGAAPGAAVLTINMPSGRVIDTSQVSGGTSYNNTYTSQISIVNDGVDRYMGFVDSNNSTTSFRCRYDEGDTTENDITATAPFSFGAGDKLHITIKGVPIVGLGATATLGQDAATHTIVTRASGDAASASAGDPVIFPTKDFGNDGSYGTATGLYTVEYSGKYKVYGYVNSANATITLNIAKSGTTDVAGGITDGNGEGAFVGIVDATAGQTLSLEPSNTLDVGAGSWISFERISGPAQIAASEAVNARYSTNAANTPTSGASTILDFEDLVYTSHGNVTTGASWKFTANKAAKYCVSSKILFASGDWVAGNNLVLNIHKNGSATATSEIARHVVEANVTTTMGINGSDCIYLISGDYIDLRVNYTRTAGNLALYNDGIYNFVSITEVK